MEVLSIAMGPICPGGVPRTGMRHAARAVTPVRSCLSTAASVLWLAVLLMVTQLPGLADAAPVGEEEVKAAFLFNFAKFVEWPPGRFSSSADPLRFCVIASGPFDRALNNVVRDRYVNGRSMRVERPQEAKDVRGCHILFVGRWTKEKQTADLLRGAAAAGVLTVGESEEFLHQGGIINFVLENDHVSFEINVDAAGRAGVKISSKLLSLAKIARDSATREN